MEPTNNILLRKGAFRDWKALEEIEKICFPEAEAASGKVLKERLLVFPEHFWILEAEGRAVGFVNGMVTDQKTITDDLFACSSLHKEEGAWQSIFGLDVLPQYQKRGYGAMLMRKMESQARLEGRKGLILTCKKALIPFYEKLGYKEEGISASEHGGAVWYDMRLTF